MMHITPQEAKQIAEDAYIFAYSMLENYKTMYVQTVDKASSTYRAPFNQLFHMRQLLGPEFTEVVGQNNDTLYSQAWLDLGTEPLVPSFPIFRLPTPLFIENSIHRYSIGDRTPGFTPNEDGSMTIYLKHELPGADKESNLKDTENE